MNKRAEAAFIEIMASGSNLGDDDNRPMLPEPVEDKDQARSSTQPHNPHLSHHPTTSLCILPILLQMKITHQYNLLTYERASQDTPLGQNSHQHLMSFNQLPRG